MPNISSINQSLVKKIAALTASQQREVLAFLDYLRSNENASFIAYVNERTRQAVQAKERGEHFFSVAELQAEYGSRVSS
ncbi:hypothetical protein U14_03764 [Candidatus Moduliflexus flocculans]|uniref:DUF2281 domain-containing protein n=1 Tax=Candidatus Moduliflexus flocculans TaxID=1499966 RepID=A0A081BQ47_9BACT|nr:hypothetical protein U14_03764 [Candidatus Moduliflexus flocculans]